MTRISLSLILAAGLAACSVSPVISDRNHDGGTLYSDCRRAARDVCKYRETDDALRTKCVAEATYQCVGGRAN